MTTLDDDTTEFRVTLLNDLLEAEKQGGTQPGSIIEVDRYRRWAFASTGAAAVLAVIVIVLLLTGGRGGGGDDGGIKPPPGTTLFPVSVQKNTLTGDIKKGRTVSILSERTVLVSGVSVIDYREEEIAGFKRAILDVAVDAEQFDKLNQADPKTFKVRSGRVPVSDTTSPEPQETPPASEPAPAPPAPTPGG